MSTSSENGKAKAYPSIRRMLNQGFFSKLYIDQDGSVSDGEIQEPFAHLVAHLSTGKCRPPREARLRL
ncbi:hypothetical protein A3E76_05510 [Candidatus Saccharibacteria bacterium RIFCSPHIGHO2_12_FULL_44_22]|nr:MAG: hypothetical protein A3E76_05510 [Candidatus Saccharibacteria bacterium RIFCSPHIGHO2_12_FULL_44_22]